MFTQVLKEITAQPLIPEERPFLRVGVFKSPLLSQIPSYSQQDNSQYNHSHAEKIWNFLRQKYIVFLQRIAVRGRQAKHPPHVFYSSHVSFRDITI